MANCCNPDTSSSHKTTQKMACPTCHGICKSVSTTTLLQHLSFPANLKLKIDHYFYCSNPDCEIHYFSKSGTRYYNTDLHSENTTKQTGLCYCFDISQQRYRQALDNGSAAEIKNFVIEKTKLNQCACEARNPSGLCCLAEFKKLDKQK